MRVDEAGERAGQKLRDRYGDVPVPGVVPAGPSRPMVRVTAIAVAVALVLTGAVVLARSAGRDHASSASGPTWTRAPFRSVFGAGVESVELAGNASGFVAAVARTDRQGGETGIELWSSSDGRVWVRRRRFDRRNTRAAVAATDQTFAAVVMSADGRLRAYGSSDGADWSRGAAPPHQEDPGFLGSDGEVFTFQDPSPGATVPTWLSHDGRRWSARRAPYVPLARLGPCAVAMTAVSTMQPNRVATSRDLTHWTVLPGTLPPRIGRPMVSGAARRRLLTIQYEPSYDIGGGRLWTSTDAREWSEVASFHAAFPTGNPDHIVQSGRWWVLGGNRGAGRDRRATMWVTPDLRHWTEMPPRLRGTRGGGSSVVLGSDGRTVVGVSPLDAALWIWRAPGR